MAGRGNDDPDWYDYDEDERDDLRDLIPERLTEGPLDEEPRKGRSLLIAAVLIGVGIAGGAGVFLFNRSAPSNGNITAPTIPADKSAYKVRPADPGGMQVPNQDKLVYERIDPEAAAGTKVEKLLPESEAPLTPPVDLPPETVARTEVDAPPQEPAITPPPPEMPEQPAQDTPAPTADQPAAEPAAPGETAPQDGKEPAASTGPKETERAAVPPASAPETPAEAGEAASGPYMIQLAALRDEGAAAATWKRLQGAHPDLLGALSLVVQKAEVSGKGTFYRVRAKGLPSEKAARDLCEKLAQEKVGCLFVGK